MLPRVLKNFTAYVDGRGYIGRVESCQLPDLATADVEYRGGGMDAPVDLDMGTAKLDVQIVLAEYDPNIIKLWGVFTAETPIVLRGAIQRQGEDAVPVVVRLQGRLKQISRAQWQSGQNSAMTITANCNRYTEQLAGVTLVDIDILNMRRVVGGVDQMAGIRAALGA